MSLNRRLYFYYVVVGLATAAIVVLSGFLVWKQREEGYAMAELSVTNTADILAIQVESSLDQNSALLGSIGRRYADAARRGPAEVAHLVDQIRIDVPSYPLLSHIGITNERGASLFNTGLPAESKRRLDLADRDYFQRARSGEQGLIYSGPLESRLTGEWSLVLARRLESQAGAFMGIAYAVVPVQAIGKTFAHVAVGASGIVNLRTADLAQVVRYPELAGANRDIGNRNVSQTIQNLMREQPERDHYVYKTVAPIDGIERVYTFRKFDHTPLWMTVGRASADFETAWERTAAGLAALSLVMASLLVWGARRLTTQHLDLGRRLAEKEAAERRLRDSEARYRTILDNAADAIFVADAQGRYLYVNRQVHRLLGYTREEMLQMSIADITPTEDAAHSAASLVALKESGQMTTELLLKRVGGSLIPVEINTILLPDGTAFGACRDITERKQSAAELEQHRHYLEQLVDARTADLLAANSKLTETQFAMDSVGIGIHWVDADTGRFVHANQIAADMLGYSTEEMLGLRVSDIDPNFSADAFRHMTDSLRQQGHAKFETANRARDGRMFPVEVSLYFLPEKQHEAARFITFVSDITQRKEAETALIQAKEMADAANRSKGAFLANMSHEIRTPLNAISGMSRLVRREPLTQQQKDRLDKLDSAAAHLHATINDILDLSKIEAGRLDLSDGPVHLQTLFAGVMDMLQERVQAKHLSMHCEIADVPYPLFGDPTRLKQALLNYAGNAIKFTHSGSITLYASIAQEADGQSLLRFEVRDTGIGIALDSSSKLFSAFEQGDASLARQYGGTGLGLAITKKLAEAMGGEVGVASTLGVGSSFWFTAWLRLGPIIAGTAEEPVEFAVEADPKHVLQRDYQGRRVLLAEDDPFNQEVGRIVLEDVGLVVDVAEDGNAAVALAAGAAYDIILMDMQMPHLDGLDATRQIRQTPTGPSIPIIAMTANAFAEDRLRCMEAGMDDFVTKPIEPPVLYRAILRWLKGAPRH